MPREQHSSRHKNTEIMDFDISNMRFPAPLTVTELNEYIKDLLDCNPPLTEIYIKGEISNFKAHSSGHYYFSLKDEQSALRCVMFRSAAYSLNFRPENGMKVIAGGKISSFVRDGAYQLYVTDMQPDGIGSMYIAVEQLKRKLEAEGLFDESRKKEIPKIPHTVGVVTSPTGAAVRDIINVTGRRFPFAEIVIYPALVQGEGAVESVARGIEYFNREKRADVLIVGRGGGSIEDLWAFNSERVARAVAASDIPVISAVGHETDFTVCDFVSDRRAPTPSAAAEIAVPDTAELVMKFNNVITRERDILLRRIADRKTDVKRIEASRALASPMNTVEDRMMALASLSEKLDTAAERYLTNLKSRLSVSAASLDAINPLKVLTRGYSAVMTESGKVANSIEGMTAGDKIKIRMQDGTLNATVNEIETL